MNQAVDMLKINDTDLLKLEQVEPFRQYLVGHKCKTRKGNGNAQLLFVGTSAGWAVVQKGAGGTVKTPIGLRPVIEDFLKSPLTRSLGLAKRMREAHQLDLDNDLAQRVAAAVADPAPAPTANTDCAGLSEAASFTPVCGTLNGTLCVPGESSGSREAAERSRQWSEFGELLKRVDAECKNAGPHFLVSPELRERMLKGGIKIYPAPAADLQHLEDLRDDFAIHCPLPMLEGEDLATYADRRWAYADLMMSKRNPQDADK